MFTIAKKILRVYNDNASFTYYDKIVIMIAVLFLVVSLNLELFWDMVKTFWFGSELAKILIIGVVVFISYQVLNAVYSVLKSFNVLFLQITHSINRILAFTKRMLVYAAYIIIFYFVYTLGIFGKSVQMYNDLKLRIEAFKLVESIPETTKTNTVYVEVNETQNTGVSYKEAYEGVLLQLEEEKKRLQRVLELKQDTALQNYKTPVVPLSSAYNPGVIWTMVE